MIHLSYNGTLYSYDNKTTTTVSSVTNIPITIHPYEDIEGAKLYYKQNDTEGIVDISNNTANIPGAYLVTGNIQVALRLASGTMSNTFTIGVTVISSSGDIMDDDIQFTMDNKKRLILVPGYQTLLAIQFDNESEIVTFKFPRYQESVDLSTKTPYVNYRRPQVKDLGKALCTIDKVDEDTIYFSWMVDASVTQYEGTIQFQVEFYGNDGYRWQSQIGELPILTSLYNTGLEPYTPDIMEQYIRQLQSIKSDAEAYAVGTRNGTAVAPSDPTYHNNSKYYAEQGGGGGTSDYSALSNKPTLNGVTIDGSKTSSDYHITGLSTDVKQALLQLAQKVAYVDAHGQDYYDDLYDALYPSTPVMTGITATFVQGSTTIYDTDSLNSLKEYLTVTADYDTGPSTAVPSNQYQLSGTLSPGTSVITVSYSGFTDTFSVTVTQRAAVLESISATFNQGSTTIYDDDSLDSLKEYLTVIAHYSDSTSAEVDNYTLSGSLVAGTSTITVSYSGETTTFNVNVTHRPPVYTVSNTLVGCTNSNSATTATENTSYSGTITASSGYTLTGATVSITMGGVDITSTAYSSGTISIAMVTGNIAISVTAVAVVLSSISAVYTQSGTVYDTDSLDSLKPDLAVTATYSDSSTQIIPSTDYTLSGTLAVGTSTVTVSYGGKTDTFNVTVTSASYVSDGLIMWLDGEKNGVGGAHETTLTTWVDQSGNGWDWTNSNATVGDKSVIFNGSNSHLTREYQNLPSNVAMIEIVLKGTKGGCIITGFGRNKIGNTNIATTSDNMTFHTGTGTEQTSNTAFHIGTDEAMDNTICSVNSAGYLNGEQIETTNNSSDWRYEYPAIGLYRGSGGNGTQYIFKGEIYCIRLYSRILTEAEILRNYAIDSRRFGIGG